MFLPVLNVHTGSHHLLLAASTASLISLQQPAVFCVFVVSPPWIVQMGITVNVFRQSPFKMIQVLRSAAHIKSDRSSCYVLVTLINCSKSPQLTVAEASVTCSTTSTLLILWCINQCQYFIKSYLIITVWSQQLFSLIDKLVWHSLKCLSSTAAMKQRTWRWNDSREECNWTDLTDLYFGICIIRKKHYVNDRVKKTQRSNISQTWRLKWVLVRCVKYRCLEMLNEACNEPQKVSLLLPAALMSEHKDHRQDGNNWRAAGVSQLLNVYLYRTWDPYKTLQCILAFGHEIIHANYSVHILKHETCM